MTNTKKTVYILSLIALTLFLMHESRIHFDPQLIKIKKEALSAQKDWSVFYGQSQVYLNGGLRHDQEFSEIAALLEPGSALITDLATSYYAAAGLPIYVKNVHRHHGRHKAREWERLISHRITCYLDAPEYMAKFLNVMVDEEVTAKKRKVPPVRYIAVNRTHYNDNFKRGCMSQRRRGLLSVIGQLGTPVYEGETITLYKLSAASAQRDQYGP